MVLGGNMTDIWEMRKNLPGPKWQHISERPEIMKRTAKRWTEEENDKLIELKRDGLSHKGIANALNEIFDNNRTSTSIDVRVLRIHNDGIDLDTKVLWSDEETEMLIHLHKTNESRTSIVTMLNDAFSNDRTLSAIGGKIHNLNLTNPSQCGYCKEYGHNKRTCAEFKKHIELVKSENETITEVIEEVVEEMEEEYVELARSSRKRWTVDEEQYMVELAYEQVPYSEITEKLNEEFGTGRSTAAIISRLSVMHSGNMRYLKKSWKDSWSERRLDRKEKRIQKKILRIQNKIAKLQAKISALGAKL